MNDEVRPTPPSRGRATTAFGVASVLTALAAWAMPAAASTDRAFDFANTRAAASTVAVSLTAGEGLATALVVEEDAHRHILDWTYYEFGGSHGIETNISSPAPTCSPCTTPLATKTVTFSRSLPSGHHLVVGVSGAATTTTVGRGVRTRRFDGYAATQGDTPRVDSSAGESGDNTAVEVGRFTAAGLPRLPGPSLVLASLPCETAGYGDAVLRGTSRPIAMNCTDTYLTDVTASRPTSWTLTGDVTGITGLRARLVAIVLR